MQIFAVFITVVSISCTGLASKVLPYGKPQLVREVVSVFQETTEGRYVSFTAILLDGTSKSLGLKNSYSTEELNDNISTLKQMTIHRVGAAALEGALAFVSGSLAAGTAPTAVGPAVLGTISVASTLAAGQSAKAAINSYRYGALISLKMLSGEDIHVKDLDSFTIKLDRLLQYFDAVHSITSYADMVAFTLNFLYGSP